jgi:hypothetical protein
MRDIPFRHDDLVPEWEYGLDLLFGIATCRRGYDPAQAETIGLR